MANNIKLNLESVTNTISEVKNTIMSNQSDIDAAYDSLVDYFAESSGETADALRRLQKAEQDLADEVWITLMELANSIEFAAEEFSKLDTDTKNVMETPALRSKNIRGGKINGQNI